MDETAVKDEDQDPRKPKDSLYQKVYDDTKKYGSDLDHMIVERVCDTGLAEAESMGRVYGGEVEGNTTHASYTRSLQELQQQRQESQKRYQELVANLLSHEPDLQAQEERRAEGSSILERQSREAAVQQERIERLQRQIQATRQATQDTSNRVSSCSTYKEYVERSVSVWGTEAQSVEDVCGRFRDLLTLRLQLLLKVKIALNLLQKARKNQLQVVQ
ncbi:unnamed protein product, partial [Meganyctiphanes norvegica]